MSDERITWGGKPVVPPPPRQRTLEELWYPGQFFLKQIAALIATSDAPSRDALKEMGLV